MKFKRQLCGVLACVGMLILILDGKTALIGGRTGIAVCIRTVIPSLFPFFLLSILLTQSLSGQNLKALRPLGKLLGIPAGAEGILVCGFLGGYPVGAQCTADLYRRGMLSKKEAERMLCFCSNAGPAFLFGMAASLFPRIWYGWLLWAIHIFSALTVRMCFPGNPGSRIEMEQSDGPNLSAALNRSIRIMAAVCGWVVLFRILIAFLDRWTLWFFPSTVRFWVIGLLELANGCCELAALPNLSQRFVLCAAILSFGGLCVTMQTASVTEGLSLKYYISGKLLQGLFSLLLAWAFTAGFIPILALCLAAGGILMKMRKRSSIRAEAGV